MLGEGFVPFPLPNLAHLIDSLAMGNQHVEMRTLPIAFGASPIGMSFLNHPQDSPSHLVASEHREWACIASQ